jgi:hypothetical protein
LLSGAPRAASTRKPGKDGAATTRTSRRLDVAVIALGSYLDDALDGGQVGLSVPRGNGSLA